MLVAVSGASRLFIGKPKRGGVDDMERNYEVSSASIGGSPREGNVVVRLPAGEMGKEKSCLLKMAGVRIQWAAPGGDAGHPDFEGQVLVKDVRFSRAARVDPGGQVAPTGDFVATLEVSETWTGMVVREMKAHSWGIAGSALLMAATGLAGWLIRRTRKAFRHGWSNPGTACRRGGGARERQDAAESESEEVQGSRMDREPMERPTGEGSPDR